MFTTIVRTLILYVVLIIAMRLMGKRQVGEMQPAELVVTILISEIAAIPIQDRNQPIMAALVSILILVSFEILLTVLTMKSAYFNSAVNGKSAVIIEDGKILQKRLKALRITVADLMEMLREQGIFDIKEVGYAIFETNGTLSVMQKPFFAPARIGDVSSSASGNGDLPSLVISDGRVLKRGLSDAKTTYERLTEILRTEGIGEKEIFIMTMDSSENVCIIKKEDAQ